MTRIREAGESGPAKGQPKLKTGAQTRVIGRAVVELLAGAKPAGANEDDPVCAGNRPGRPFVGIDKLRVRIYRAAGLAGFPGVDPHSLRHTFASLGAYCVAI